MIEGEANEGGIIIRCELMRFMFAGGGWHEEAVVAGGGSARGGDEGRLACQEVLLDDGGDRHRRPHDGTRARRHGRLRPGYATRV